MLEKEGLLDQNKLNNLIDLSKKEPKAIAQLLKDSGIDPLDIDTAEEVSYKPTDYGVTDKEFQLNQVIDDIKDSPSFDKILALLQLLTNMFLAVFMIKFNQLLIKKKH